MPGYAAIFNNNRLGRFMPELESFGNCVRHAAVLDNQHEAAGDIRRGSRKVLKLLVGLRADRALRAMLENENGIGFRALQKLFEILLLA